MRNHRIIWHTSTGGGQLTTNSLEVMIQKIREVFSHHTTVTDIVIYTLEPEKDEEAGH